jgi:dipeptidyl aminopeptidase/acylaminoacyl peptidase
MLSLSFPMEATMRTFLKLACAATFLTTIVLAQTSPRLRALTIEDYYKIKTIGDPQISPNAKWVTFTVSTKNEEDNTTSIETYVVPADGSAQPRKIEHEGKNVANPRWTDDSMLQYSLNARVNSAIFLGSVGMGESLEPQRGRGSNQGELWKVSIDTPNSTPVQAQPRTAGAVLSFDGKWIAEAKDRSSTAPTVAYASDFEKRHMERFKGKQFDWMRFQQDGQEFPTPDPRLRPAAEITITPAGGGSPKELTNLGMRPASLAWHPNGTMIAFTAEENWKNEQYYENPDIYTVTTDGKITRVTNDGYVWNSLAYSPDGKFLLARRTFGTDMIIKQKLHHGGSDDLLIWPVGGGTSINLTDKFDLEPVAPRWSADSRYVYFTAEKGGTIHLFRIAPRAGATVEQVTQGERRLNNVTFDKAMTKIAYTVGTYEAPSEVWTANIDGSGEKKLTNVASGTVNEIGITKTERLKWKSNDGTEIEGWLTYPYGYDKNQGKYPLAVFNHGGPHSAEGYGFNFKQQYFAANGYFVLDTNFRSSTGYGDAFKWATWGAWGNKDGQDVMSGIDYVIKNYPVDTRRVGTMGHSYGGFMTNWLITTYPDRFAAAASGAGISNWLSDYGNADIYRTKETEFLGTPWQEDAIQHMIAQSPLTHAGKVRTPTLFISGEADQRVPYEEVEQMYFALRRQGVPAKMLQYAGQPHGISGHWNNVHRMLNELKWFDAYLKP